MEIQKKNTICAPDDLNVTKKSKSEKKFLKKNSKTLSWES